MKTFNINNKKGKVVATGLSEQKAIEKVKELGKGFTYSWDFESEDEIVATDNVSSMDTTEYNEYSVESENTFQL